MRTLAFAVCLAVACWSAQATAGEIARLHADLDGDGKPETIVLSISGSGDFQHFKLRTGSSEYSADFFAVYGDVPELKTVRIDAKTSKRQLLVTTFGASTCDYHLLNYVNGRLYLLFTGSSEGCDESPIMGYGKMRFGRWMGFWDEEDEYTLDASGTKLILQPASEYHVGVVVAAAKAMELAPSTCKDTRLSPGQYVKIDAYDPKGHRYLLRSVDSLCGWLPEDQLDNDLAEIPYAK